MTESSKNQHSLELKIRILLILCFILSISLLLGLIFPRARQIKSISTVLLNPKYIPDVSTIELSNAFSKIILTKNGFAKSGLEWIGALQNMSGTILDFPAETRIINDFLHELVQKRELYQMSEKPSSFDKFGLSEKKAIRLQIKGENGQLYTDLYFGNEDYTGHYIFMRTSKPIVYQMTTVLRDFLQFSPETFANMRLIPFNISAQDILYIEIINANGTKKTITNTFENAKKFDSYANKFFMSALSIVDFTVSAPPENQINIVTQSKTYTLNLYMLEKNYICVPSFYSYALHINQYMYESLVY